MTGEFDDDTDDGFDDGFDDDIDDEFDDGSPTGPGLDDPRVQAGLDHLQRAAREVIAASRALLDVAEELVDDPKAAAGMVDLVSGLAGMAGRAGRSRWVTAAGAAGDDVGDDDPDEDDDPPVQRIPVS